MGAYINVALPGVKAVIRWQAAKMAEEGERVGSLRVFDATVRAAAGQRTE
jgi:hypothetical protein